MRITTLMSAWFIAVATAHAGDWPCWRGPTGQGATTEKNLPLEWSATKNLLWKATLPGSEDRAKLDHNQSSPIVWKDRAFLIMVYWPADVSPREFPKHIVACYRTTDGHKLWQAEVAPGPWKLTDLRGGYSAPTPCTDGKCVFALFGSSVLAALDFDGNLVWRREVAPYAWDVAIGTSPFLHQGNVLILADGIRPKDSRLIAFDAKTGDIRWQEARPTMSFSHGTPLLIDVAGKSQWVVAASNALQGLDPSNGKVLWWTKHPGDVPTPVYDGKVVFSIDGRGRPGIAVAPTGMGDVSATHVKWRTPSTPQGFSSAAVAGPYLYRINGPDILKCYKLDDGSLLFSERLANGIPSALSPIVTPDRRIYIASAGKSVVVAAGPKYEVLATSDLGDPSAASPAVADGRLFLKGMRHLYCVGSRD